MRHTEIFTGRIGRIQDLFQLKEGNCVINFSVAETPRKKVNDEWVDDTTIWTDVSLWGDEARAFAMSDIKPGTQVIIVGVRTAREYDADEGKRIKQTIRADEVGVLITRWDFIEKMGKISNGSYGEQAQSKPATSKPKAASQVAPAKDDSDLALELDVADDDMDLFSDNDLFGDDGDLFDII